jgi:hypothetical protein
MMDNRVTLVPAEDTWNGKPHYEMIVMKQDGMSAFIFQVDFLWTNDPAHQEIHGKLCRGETVECELTLREIEKE